MSIIISVIKITGNKVDFVKTYTNFVINEQWGNFQEVNYRRGKKVDSATRAFNSKTATLGFNARIFLSN